MVWGQGLGLSGQGEFKPHLWMPSAGSLRVYALDASCVVNHVDLSLLVLPEAGNLQ
jgi:hypothetical protein